MKKFMILLLAFLALNLSADTLKIGAGAGYKKPVNQIINKFNQNGDVAGIFGNMGQVCSQAKATNLAIIIGDRDFLEKKCGVEFSGFEDIGKGKIVFVSNKEIRDLSEIDKLNKIAMPQPQKAIYGIRAAQVVKNLNLKEKLGDKLIEVATVPQVSAYILSGDIDGGFVNLTESLAQNFKTNLIIDEKLYDSVIITAGHNCKNDTECKKFLDFLRSNSSKEIFSKFGL